MEQILITRANSTVELINSTNTVTSIISAEHRKASLGEDVVVMTVESAVDRAFAIGDSIKLFGGNTYKINQIPSVEKISERLFRYELVFEGIQYDLLRVLYKNEDVSTFSTSAEFALTGDIEMFLNVLINNANRVFGANKWVLGEFPLNTETKNLLFSNENCLTVLQRICSEYSYEFTFTETSTQKILNIKSLGSELDFTFEYGKGKGLYNLKRDSVDSKKIINKLFAYGSTKNIPANYKNYSQRLHFGTVSPFTDSVVSDDTSIANFGVCEGSIIFDDVFPTGYNSITAINTSNRLEFTDTSMGFDLNAKDVSGNTLYLIPSVSAKIHFNTGNLAGYEFEVEKYTHSTKKFILKPVIDEKGFSIPSLTESAFFLSVGDNYSLLDIVMPQSLIDAAESLLQSKAVDYLNENKAPIVKYSVAVDEVYLKDKTNNLNVFDVGDSVIVNDSDFNINTRIKIISFSRNILYPYRYSIVVSDVPEIGVLRALTTKSNEADRIIRHNGFNDPTKFKQDPNSNNQIQSQIDETINRKPSVLIGRESTGITLGNSENDTLIEILGRFGIRNQNNFLAQFSVADLTANHTVKIPNRNIEVNKWADLSGVPSLFSPTTHTHQIGDIINLNAVLDAKQPLNGNLTSIGLLSTNGIVRRTGLNNFVIGTNDPITLTGDVNGTGTTVITTTLSNTGVAAGVYKSVMVDAKGRVTAGTLRSASNYLSDFGFIEDYSTQWNTRWLAKIDDFIEFGSDIQINGGLGVIGNLFLNGNFFDKSSSIGSANQVLMPASGGGVAWTSLSTAQISNFSANVLGQLLTGYTVGSNTPLVASNSILTAFRNLQAQITAKTTAERLVFGNGFFQNHQFGNGFEYKTSLPLSVNGLITGLFSFGGLTANRTWNMPDYNGTLTTYEKIDAEFWKIGGNNNITANAYFNIQSKYDLVNNVLVQQQPYSYVWAINQVDKMRLTPQGNLGVGGINPEAVIHAHATVVGNAEVIALKASNNTSNSYFSIGIDSTNNRTNFYAGGEVWATTVSKFKFAAADVSGLWTYSVIPQTTADATTGNELVRLSQVQTLLSGGFSISTTCVLVFITNQTLSGSKTQGGYTTVTGNSILLTAQTTPSQNGVYIFDGTNWVRNTNNDTDTEIRGKGHLVTNGTYASTQWVNNNASAITVGTTAITYVQWSGAELDPVWEAYKAANDLTPTRFANWNTAFAWGNHTNLYVDKVSTQADIAGAKTFTTSIQSPQVRAGNNTLYINISNNFGSSPRIASTAHMDFFATTDYYWYTNGNLGRMRLNTTGLRVGDANAAAYSLDVGGNVGISGLINVRNPITSTYSNGTDGQVILRKSVSGLNYNEWATLGVANISDIAATYQAKITGTENYLTKKTASNFGDSQLFDDGTSVVIGGTSAIDNAKFSVVGKIGSTNARFGDNSSGINIGSLTINSTGALDYGATSHTWNVSSTEKLNLNSTRLLLTGNLEIDGKIKVGGSYGLDHYFIKSLGVDVNGNPLGTEWAIMNCGEISDIADLYVSKTFADANYVKRITDDGERGFYLYGDTDNTIKDGFIFSNPDTGIVGIHSFRLNNTTIEQFGYQLDKDGFPYWLFADGSRKRILTTNDAVGGGGTNSGVLGGNVTSDLNFGVQRNIFWRSTGIFDPTNFAAKLFWQGTGTYTSNIFTTAVQGMIFEANTDFNIGTTNSLRLKGNKVYVNEIELDMAKVAQLIGK